MRAFSVALVGLDGAGKTTVARRLERDDPDRFAYVYMGDNPASSNVTLPTTRWWKARTSSNPGTGRPTRSRRRLLGRVLRPLRKTFGFANRVLEEAYRQRVVRRYLARGVIVVIDRHFLLDYHHGDETSKGRGSFKRRLQRGLRRRLLPLPELVIVLDLPADVALRRKQEFSLEHLQARRDQYLGLRSLFDHTVVVDANRDLDRVVGDVRDRIDAFGNSG